MADEIIEGPPTPDSVATPASVATIGQWIVDNEDLKGTPDFNVMAEQYMRLSAEEGTPATEETESLGFWGGVGEAFSGNERNTPEVETLPKAGMMPELDLFSGDSEVWPQLKAAFGIAMGNQEEMAKVIQSNFPNVTVRFDSKNNPILRSGIDSKEYIISPGFDLGDIGRGGFAAGIFALTKGRGYLGTGIQGAGTQTVYEGLQKRVGGEFNEEDVLAAGLLGPAFHGVVQAGKAGWGRFAQRFLNKGAPPSSIATLPALSDEEIIIIARQAANGNNEAKIILQEMGAPDEQLLAAAQRLGIEDFLQPDHTSTNQTFIEISQAAKSFPGSKASAAEAEGLANIGQRAVELIEELGGTTDLSKVNTTVFNRLKSLIDDELQPLENKLWTDLRAKIGEASRFNPAQTLEYLEQRIASVGGRVEDLRPLERQVWDRLKPVDIEGTLNGQKIIIGQETPTYGLIEQWRGTVGAATRGQGPYADTERGAAQQLYKMLAGDVEAIAKDAGAESLQRQAKATSKLLMSFEDDNVALFGKELGKSIVPTINNSIGAMSRGDASAFINLMRRVPATLRREVAVSSIVNSFGNATKNGALNYNSYVRWYEGLLRNREAKAVLDKALGPEARKTFRDLYDISKGVNRAIQEKIRTGRPRGIVEGLNEADTLLNKLWDIGKRSALGVPVEVGLQFAGMPPMYGMVSAITAATTRTLSKKEALAALDSVMSSPAFVNALRSAGTAQEQQAARQLANSTPFKRFMQEVGLPPTDGESFIISAFQAGRAGYFDGYTDEVPVVPETDIPEVAPPQARVQPPAPPARGVPGFGQQAVAQGSSPPAPNLNGPASREMLKDLFPFDSIA